MDEELVERVARAILEAMAQRPMTEAEWQGARSHEDWPTAEAWARAVIPIVQEHDAKVADDFERTENERAYDKRQEGRDDNFNCARASAARMLAQAIRGKA